MDLAGRLDTSASVPLNAEYSRMAHIYYVHHTADPSPFGLWRSFLRAAFRPSLVIHLHPIQTLGVPAKELLSPLNRIGLMIVIYVLYCITHMMLYDIIRFRMNRIE